MYMTVMQSLVIVASGAVMYCLSDSQFALKGKSVTAGKNILIYTSNECIYRSLLLISNTTSEHHPTQSNTYIISHNTY